VVSVVPDDGSTKTVNYESLINLLKGYLADTTEYAALKDDTHLA